MEFLFISPIMDGRRTEKQLKWPQQSEAGVKQRHQSDQDFINEMMEHH